MHERPSSKTVLAAARLLLLLSALAIGACGGSSTPSQGSTPPPRGTPATAATVTARLDALRTCLHGAGVDVPVATLATGGESLPHGLSRARFQDALRRCSNAAGAEALTRARTRSAAFKQAVGRYAACMRGAGVNLPEPNTSGTGPLFSAGALNPSKPNVRAGLLKCFRLLQDAYGVKPGAG